MHLSVTLCKGCFWYPLRVALKLEKRLHLSFELNLLKLAQKLLRKYSCDTYLYRWLALIYASFHTIFWVWFEKCKKKVEAQFQSRFTLLLVSTWKLAFIGPKAYYRHIALDMCSSLLRFFIVPAKLLYFLCAWLTCVILNITYLTKLKIEMSTDGSCPFDA